MKIKRKHIDNEIAIIGSKSEVIVRLSSEISKKIEKNYKIAFFDDIDKIDNFEIKTRISQLDFVLLNGRNFSANQQILLLDELLKVDDISTLSNLQFVVKTDENSEYPDFLIEKYPTIKNLKTYYIEDIDAIVTHIENIIKESIPTINGLILIGGKSTRMGKDKSKLTYHGMPQGEYAFHELEKNIISNAIFYSVRDETQLENKAIITDKFIDLGPFGAICSAFMYNPNKAWLAIATDLPLVDSKVINKLIDKRNSSKIATTFKGKNSSFPEPLITIWEPKAYPILLHNLAKGELSLTKILKQHNVEIIEIEDEFIQNINTLTAYYKITKKT